MPSDICTVGLLYPCVLRWWIPCRWIQPTTGPKYLGKKSPESSKKQNLNLWHTSNYLHGIYIVLSILVIYRWFKVYRRICVGYMQILCHFIWDLSIHGFWYPQVSWIQSPMDAMGQLSTLIKARSPELYPGQVILRYYTTPLDPSSTSPCPIIFWKFFCLLLEKGKFSSGQK